MRIRKRPSGDASGAYTPLPISCRLQATKDWADLVQVGAGGEVAAGIQRIAVGKAVDMQSEGLEADDDGAGRGDWSAKVHTGSNGVENAKILQANLNVESSEALPSLVEVVDTDIIHVEKRHKVDHESSSSLFQGPSTMTAAELLVVHELANGVRERLHAASGNSTSEHTTTVTTRVESKLAENSKDALISSIFFVFDAWGESGLSASEVVRIMIEQSLPGLKEGGARHTVQVANVLRSSSSFIALGDKRYLLCSNLDSKPSSKRQRNSYNPEQRVNPAEELSEDSMQRHHHQGKKSNGRVSLSGSSVVTESKPLPSKSCNEAHSNKKGAQTSQSSTPRVKEVGSSEQAGLVVKVRRRGPLSSQKGKGPTQCKRYDGRGWQCSRMTEPGYSLCVHHQDLINRRAAKLKEAQTMSRMAESVHRKANSTLPNNNPNEMMAGEKSDERSPKPRPPSSGGPDIPVGHVHKRKMLSLLAIK